MMALDALEEEKRETRAAMLALSYHVTPSTM
jgi:hypothetical protein